ncbi:hypothetical protein R3P38DRAFT_2795457 [Favolaschia claudopus]|uniref:Uncharacterized protein n=1 Tax=Favolaschia claudopus TaxID=2862362 RepID=A0AAW0A7U4_9AGAR
MPTVDSGDPGSGGVNEGVNGERRGGGGRANAGWPPRFFDFFTSKPTVQTQLARDSATKPPTLRDSAIRHRLLKKMGTTEHLLINRPIVKRSLEFYGIQIELSSVASFDVKQTSLETRQTGRCKDLFVLDAENNQLELESKARNNTARLPKMIQYRMQRRSRGHSTPKSAFVKPNSTEPTQQVSNNSSGIPTITKGFKPNSSSDLETPCLTMATKTSPQLLEIFNHIIGTFE